MERIKKMIQEEVMRIVAGRFIKDPRVPDFITVTRMTLSKDLHYAHIYFTLFGEENNASGKIQLAVDGLNSASGFIQKILAEKINLRYTPKIEFRYDEKESRAYKVDKILDALAKERQMQNNSTEEK